jgi:hypothetical protein
MPLTDVSIRNAKATDRPVKLCDGDGLYLLIHPNGSQWWAQARQAPAYSLNTNT